MKSLGADGKSQFQYDIHTRILLVTVLGAHILDINLNLWATISLQKGW